MAGKIAFSEKALEQMNSGARAAVLTGVKAPWTWFLLSAVSLVLAALVFWGFYGSMVESVSGIGITLLREGAHPIIAGGSGSLSYLNIKAGAVIRENQILGQINNPEHLFNLRKVESEYRLLQSEVQFLKAGTQKMIATQLALNQTKKKHLDRLAKAHALSRERADDVVKMQSRLHTLGATSKLAYYQSLDNQVQAEGSFLSVLFQALEADSVQQERIWEREQRILQLGRELEQKKKDVQLVQKLFREAFWITSDFDGQVQEVFKSEGDFVQKGEKIALVGTGDQKGIYLLAFVSPEQGKKIRNGMSAFFSIPAAAATAGYLKCVVREVSPMPINPETIQAELMNESITQMIAGRSAVVRVVLELIPDSKSLSGFAWTSRRGYTRPVGNGMMGEVIIHTAYRAPASYIIPALRELVNHKRPAKKTVVR